MSAKDRNHAAMRLWILLSVAFAVMAAAGAAVFLQFSASRDIQASRRSALSIATFMATHVHDTDSKDVQRILEDSRSSFPGILFAKYIPVDRTKFVGVPRNMETAERARASRVATVTMEDAGRESVPIFTACAPVIGNSGQVKAIVEVTVRRVATLGDVVPVPWVAGLGLVLSSLLGGLFASGVTTRLIADPVKSQGLRVLKKQQFLRSRVVELLLSIFAAIGLITGVAGLMALNTVTAQSRDLRYEEGRLENIQSRLLHALNDPQELERVRADAARVGIVEPTHQALAIALDSELSGLHAKQDEQRQEISEFTFRLAGAFALCALLTIGSIVLLRMTMDKEHELDEARWAVAKGEAAHRQVAENLPIAFYTYGLNRIQYCNEAWCHMVGHLEGEDPSASFARALHPDDCHEVMDALRDAVVNKTGFGFSHRLKTVSGEVRHVETRGVPILDDAGALQHVVGFMIDVTSRVRARQLLEAKTIEVEATNARLRDALSDLEENFEAMAHTLVKAVEAKDPYTAGHSERVMRYSVKIGEALGLSTHELRVLRMGTLMHDIGKIGVPDDVLTKPEKLSPLEMERVRSHPAVGARMIEGIPMFRECLPIVLHHHERLDGSGYPHGLKGDRISLIVRIAAVADCFDAMTSTRAYRSRIHPTIALQELEHSADIGILDRRIVAELADIVSRGGLINLEEFQAAA